MAGLYEFMPVTMSSDDNPEGYTGQSPRLELLESNIDTSHF